MISSLTCVCVIVCAIPPDSIHGTLWEPAFSIDTIRRGTPVPYEPQPGDLVLLNAGERLWKASYRLALSGPPTHSAIVLRMPDGGFGFLEGGIGFDLRVELSPLAERLPQYYGDIYVRRRKTPLSKDESDRLTEFALAVNQQRITVARFPLQATPIRTRGPVRTAFLGKPRGIGHHTWTCSELVVEAYVAAGLLDANTARPAATYPRDFFFDHSVNCYLNRHLSPQIACGWHVPQHWTKCGEW